MKLRAPFGPIWSMPIFLGAITVASLASALLGDGIWDVVTWVGLCIPLAVIARFVRKSARTSS